MSYILVSNIPTQYRSAKLRKYFAEYIEKAAFECFHFRHRPEDRREENRSAGDGTTKKTETCCCVVKVKGEHVAEFVAAYHARRWDEEDRGLGCSMLLTIQCDEALTRLPELHPPVVMPCGNVGTPTTVFRDMVNSCTLPPAIIKKLGLTFPRLIKRKQYSAVTPPTELYEAPVRGYTKDYSRMYKPLTARPSKAGTAAASIESASDCVTEAGTVITSEEGGEGSAEEVKEGGAEEGVGEEGGEEEGGVEEGGVEEAPTMSSTAETSSETSVQSTEYTSTTGSAATKPSSKRRIIKRKQSKPWTQSGIEEELDKAGVSVKEQTEEDGEDWDRYCQLHNDVDTQARTKEMNRLFESDMEVVWDKGSSGLVFYTDGNYWEELEGKDTDELWTDDWDVDMGVYEGQDGDKDSQDLLAMRKSKRQKKTGDLEHEEEIGDFEKYTNGFGSRMMRKQGWNVGEGLGKADRDGLKHALDAEGGMPSWKKTGFGYRGSMLKNLLKKKHDVTRAPPILGSKYDTVITEKESMYRTHDEDAMKYRRPK